MHTEVSGSQRTARVAALKGFGIGALMVGLIALMAVATFRETAKPKPQQIATNSETQRPAVTGGEEAYARALWPIHAQVKQDAVKMTFAGLAYKMGDIKQQDVSARVAPLTPAFDAAAAALGRLRPPASLLTLHGEYLQAIKLYRDASLTMVKFAADGREAHLIDAQVMSERASELTLKVGETLWPGEFKPN
ncbi:MAG TPA: hypothetical protein VJ719_16260 [Chthoniobacterales bacterium]|nr:hypothetical protein [Chthoniobacterales bacterium]